MDDFNGSSGKQFKFKKGTSKVRVLDSAKEPVATHFVNDKPITCIGIKNDCPHHNEGDRKPSIKYPMYLYDLEAKKIVLAFVPYSVVRSLSTLQNSAEWAFENLPMPYDITVTYDPDATPAEMYRVLPIPRKEETPKEVLEELDSLKKVKPLDALVKKLREGKTKVTARTKREVDPEPEPEDIEIP